MWQQVKRIFRHRILIRWPYLFALIVPMLTLQLLLTTPLKAFFPPGLVLLLPVLFSAFFGGLWPGLLATAMGLVLTNSVALEQLASIWNPNRTATQVSWGGAFAVIGVAISLLSEARNRALRRAELQQRAHLSTLTHIDDAVVVVATDGRISYLNQAACQLLNLPANALLNQAFDAMWQLRDVRLGHVTPIFYKFQTTGQRPNDRCAHWLIRADGSQIAIECSLAPVHDALGKLDSVVITLREVTARYETERVTQERLALQARLERIFQMVPVVVFEFHSGKDGRVQLTQASHSFTEILGLDPEPLEQDAKPFIDIIHPDDLPRIRELAAAARLEDGHPLRIEYRVITPHRGIRWVELNSAPKRAADGGVWWHGAMADITQRKQAEELFRASQLQLQAALAAGHMGTIKLDFTTGELELDANGRLLWEVDAAPQPLSVEQLQDKIAAEDRQQVAQQFARLSQHECSYQVEYRLRLDDDRERWLASRGRVYRDEVSGHLIKQGILTDVTQEHHQIAQRLHTQRLESLGILAGGIAHDFNNLLMAIAGNTQLLRVDLPPDHPGAISVREIDKACARANELIRRILTFSASDQKVSRQMLAVASVVQEVIGLARAALPANIKLESDVASDLPNIEADAGQVHQVLMNLLTNAADALAAHGGVIRYSTHPVSVDEERCRQSLDLLPGEYVCVSVHDNGQGIAAQDLPRIFDPFFTTKPKGQGTGLGLSIVHGILKSHGGAITVNSAPGKGSCFSLYFPVPPQVAHTQAGRDTPVSAPAPRRAARILYVDDEEALVFLMTRTLQRLGHVVQSYTNPAQALEQFYVMPDAFDLVVSDMTMPTLSGLDVAKQILALRPELPVIITTGFVRPQDSERAQQLGVRRLILKPNTVEELSNAIANLE